MPRLAAARLQELVAACLQRAGAPQATATATARALVYAESRGLKSHGLARVAQYVGHLRSGRVNARAHVRVERGRKAVCLVDADEGLAYPACETAVATAIELARECGVAFAGVTRSHHFGPAAYHLEPVAQAMMVGLAFSNSPAAMPVWGGRTALLGTNPVAAIFPRRAGRPLIVDLSLSQTARGKLMLAADAGQPIPPGWALDRDGQPTTDARAGLDGMMLPAGGAKGAMLALVVELLCCTLTGAAFACEADSFFADAGNRPHLGHAFVVVDPAALAGAAAYLERIEAMVSLMAAAPGVRLPGSRRDGLADEAGRDGIEVAEALLGSLRAYADSATGAVAPSAGAVRSSVSSSAGGTGRL